MRDLSPKTITVDRGKEFSNYLLLESELNCRGILVTLVVQVKEVRLKM